MLGVVHTYIEGKTAKDSWVAPGLEEVKEKAKGLSIGFPRSVGLITETRDQSVWVREQSHAKTSVCCRGMYIYINEHNLITQA